MTRGPNPIGARSKSYGCSSPVKDPALRLLPEEVACIGDAYEQALKILSIVDRDDPLTEMIAKTIIKIARTGVHDPAQLSALAI